MTTRSLLFASALLAVAACGDDGNKTTPDASGNACATPAIGEITSYPGTFSGTVVGGGRDHSAAEGACTVQTGDAWYDPKGEDVVIRLSGLTAGTRYVVNMTTMEDLSFYVTTGCPPLMGSVTDCISFTDESFTDESGVFTATGSEHYLIVDNAEDQPPATGMFSIEVSAAQCTDETEATDCAAPTPYCLDYQCVQCLSSFNCTSAAPVCDSTGTCGAGPSQCTGDDSKDTTGAGDDGPTVATMLTTPNVGVPTIATAAVCNTPAGEQDWYKLDLASAGDIGVTVDFSGATNDLDVYLLNAQGQVIARGESNAGIDEAIRGNAISGVHYIVVTQYEPANTVAAVPYTLTVARPECDNDLECVVAASPLCNGAGSCQAGQNQCVSDDAADTGGTPDDGPAAARDLTGAVDVNTSLTGSICSTPRREADWYEVTVLAGQGIVIDLSWTGTADLDPTVYNQAGDVVGMSFWKNPENVTLTYLPAGTYYIQVTNASQMASTTVQAYTIQARRTAAQTCTVDLGGTTSSNCASTYSNQFYRGSCTGGVCQFITTTGGANGSACDSGADCTSGRCSYISFEADAQDSVCTTTCTTTADCTTALGSGYTCIAGAATNFCVPSCTSNLECGADVGSDTLDASQPWDYLTCTVGTGVCSL
jgi:hypothetical protein